MAGVLEGLKVIDLAQNYAGPGVSMYLADQGADVIKVEPPGGDATRAWGPSPLLKGTAKGFLAVNRNKRSIAVDLTQPEGRAFVHGLIRTADVAIVNLRPNAAERLGIDYDTLAATNPRLIYGAVSGYGDQGSWAGRPSYDSIIQGMSGALDRTLPDGSPIRLGFFIADTSAPMIMAYGITLALLDRERTGRGQKVETSLLQAAIAMQSTQYVTLEGDESRREGDGNSSIRCADDRFISVAAHTERQFVALVQLLGLDHILASPQFLQEDHNVSVLMRTFRGEMMQAYRARPAAEWVQLLTEADIPCGPILTRQEVLQHEQVIANEMIAHVDYPEVGDVTVLGVPVRLSERPGSIRMRPPKLGEHTDEIAAEAGLMAEQIAGLRARGVLR